MSNRERIIELLDVIPDYKIGYVLAYVQGVAADEEADDIFCQRMVENYENAPDEDKEGIARKTTQSGESSLTSRYLVLEQLYYR